MSDHPGSAERPDLPTRALATCRRFLPSAGRRGSEARPGSSAGLRGDEDREPPPLCSGGLSGETAAGFAGATAGGLPGGARGHVRTPDAAFRRPDEV